MDRVEGTRMYGLRHCVIVAVRRISSRRSIMVGRRSLIGLALALLCGMVSLPLAEADSPPGKDLARAERHWENGSKAYAARNWEAAAQAFRELCEQHPQSPRTSVAYFYLGESYLQLKQPEKSHECYEKFLQQLPRHAFAKQAMFRRGEVAYLSGDHPGAQKSLHDFLAAYPKDGLAAFATVYLGEIELAAGRYGSALAWLTRAQEEFPSGPLATDCRFGSARANEEMKRYGEAELIYRSRLSTWHGPICAAALCRCGLKFCPACVALSLERIPARSPILARSQRNCASALG
jgi:TolA-binding protein